VVLRTSSFRRFALYRCGHDSRFADAVLPISYSVAFGQLHTALRQYKRGHESAARQFQLQLAAVLWRFLSVHEDCLSRHVGVDRFDIVTTVPSSAAERDQTHPLRHLVGELIEPTRARYPRLLGRHVKDDFADNAKRLKALPRPFDWESCALHP
jgi:hypothetical protein